MSETLQFDPQDEGEPPSSRRFRSSDILYVDGRRSWGLGREANDSASTRIYLQLCMQIQAQQSREDVDTDAIEVQRSEALRLNPDPQPSQEVVARPGRLSKVKQYIGKIAAHLAFHKREYTSKS